MAEENGQSRRYPQNLQGLLQLAVDAGSASEEPAPAEPMSEEVTSTLLIDDISGDWAQRH